MTLRSMLLAATLSASLQAQAAIPMRSVAAPSATTTESLGAIFGVREMADGRVLVSDPGSLRLLMFAPDLKTFTTLSDTTATSKNKYGDSPAQIIPYLGDSTLFAPYPAGATFLVLDPNGQVARATAPPKTSDMTFMRSSRTLLDARGRLFYRGRVTAQPAVRPVAGAIAVTQPPDSAPIVRADFDTRSVDTIGYVRLSKPARREITPNASGSGPPSSEKVFVTPISTVDDWTMLPDGTIAIVRGQDYHIDWISPSGVTTSSPKMSFDWRKITDEEKQRLSDSTIQAWQKLLDDAKASSASRPQRPSPNGGFSFTSVMQMDPATGSMVSMTTNAMPLTFPFDQWPSYVPPVRGNTTLSDPDGNVWILPVTSSKSAKGGIVYDVVNRKGEIFERVEMPAERSVAGFGKNGVVYLMSRDSSAVWHLEKTRVQR